MRRDHFIGQRRRFVKDFLLWVWMSGMFLLWSTSLYGASLSFRTASYQGVGVEFGVDISVAGVTDLYGFATDLIYDGEYLEVVDSDNNLGNGVQPKVIEGSLLNNNGVDPTILRAALENGNPGILVLGLSRSGPIAGVSSSNERVVLTVSFRTKKLGTTSIQFNQSGLRTPNNSGITITGGSGAIIYISNQSPGISVNCPIKDFGPVTVGSSKTLQCTVSSTGTAGLVITGVNITNPSVFSRSHGCTTLAPGNSCTASVTFSPNSAGQIATTLSISSNAGTENVELMGIGISAPKIAVSAVLLNEDFSGSIPPTWFVGGEWNSGNETSPCSGRTISSSFVAPWAIIDSSCFYTPYESLYTPVFDASSCAEVRLSFSNQYYHSESSPGYLATFVSGDNGATWHSVYEMNTSDGYPTPNNKEIDVSMVAGATEGLISFDYGGWYQDFWAIDNVQLQCRLSGPLKFRSRVNASSASKKILIQNTGSGPLVIGTITPLGTTEFSAPETNDHCSGQTIPSLGKCTFEVVFSPALEGVLAATLIIPSNDPDIPNTNLSVEGTGVAFEVIPSEGSIGTEIRIIGSGFGTKGTVSLVSPSGLVKPVKPKILEWTDTLIRCSLTVAMAPNTYDVTVQPSVPKGVLPITETGAFTFRPPQILWLSQYHGTMNDQVTILGKFFGNKKGKVNLQYETNEGIMIKSCKVSTWTMDTATGESSIVIVVPKASPGDYEVLVDPYGTIPPTEDGALFAVEAPRIYEGSPESGGVGEIITITGWFFGKTKGKVYLGTKSCTVKTWVVDPITGYGEIEFVVPNLPAALYELRVKNSVDTIGINPKYFTISNP